MPKQIKKAAYTRKKTRRGLPANAPAARNSRRPLPASSPAVRPARRARKY